VPPPHLLKKFSEQAREDSQKRGRPGYCKTFAKLCIDWALNSKSSPNNLQIGSSDITPPPELEKQWFAAWERGDNEELSFADFVIPRAAAWGADQELEACCALLDKFNDGFWCEELRAARRPKPPSLKEQALDALKDLSNGIETPDSWHVIQSALEQLDDQWAYQEHWAQEDKAVLHQDPSLADRVVMAITRDGEKARWDEARAAMLEIAKWLECRSGGTRACWLLEREAQR